MFTACDCADIQYTFHVFAPQRIRNLSTAVSLYQFEIIYIAKKCMKLVQFLRGIFN